MKTKQWWLNLLTVPFIYVAIFPIVFTDIIFEIYHRICFPIYGYKYVKRSKYIKIDRYKLSYLDWRHKIQCLYCGYVNGFLAYAVQIAAETERYWCGIKHKEDGNFIPPAHHKDFLEYGDEAGFRKYEKRGNEKN